MVQQSPVCAQWYTVFFSRSAFSLLRTLICCLRGLVRLHRPSPRLWTCLRTAQEHIKKVAPHCHRHGISSCKNCKARKKKAKTHKMCLFVSVSPNFHANLGKPAFRLTLETCSCSSLSSFLSSVGFALAGGVSLAKCPWFSAGTALSHLLTRGSELVPHSLPRSSSRSGPVSNCSSLFFVMIWMILAAPPFAYCWNHCSPQRCSRTPTPSSATPRNCLLGASPRAAESLFHDTHQDALLVQDRDGRVPILKRYQLFNHPNLLVHRGHCSH